MSRVGTVLQVKLVSGSRCNKMISSQYGILRMISRRDTVSACLFAALVMTAFVEIPRLPRYHETKWEPPLPNPRSVRIGDLSLQISPGQDFVLEPRPTRAAVDEARRSGTYDAISVALVQQQAWAATGTHLAAHGWEWSMLLLEVSARASAERWDDWCRYYGSDPTAYDRNRREALAAGHAAFEAKGPLSSLDQYIPVEPTKFFGLPVVFSLFRGHGELIRDNYGMFVALTDKVTLYLRFSEQDLRTTTPSRIISKLESTIDSWIGSESAIRIVAFRTRKGFCSAHERQ